MTITRKAVTLVLATMSVHTIVNGPNASARSSPIISARAQVAQSKNLFGTKDEVAHPRSKNAPLTYREVRDAQVLWASSIKEISAAYLNEDDFISVAGEAASKLYAYGHSGVLFKPTKASKVQFRPMASDAMSYLLGYNAIEDGYLEDHGFAINGGNGWSEVVFDNHAIELNGDTAIAMGNYYFTDATTGEKSKVEYTFGYRRCDDGVVRIFLHHSSIPYAPTNRLENNIKCNEHKI